MFNTGLSLAISDLLSGGTVSLTCGYAYVDVWQRGQVASPGEESIAHLNKNREEDEQKLNAKISLNLSQD